MSSRVVPSSKYEEFLAKRDYSEESKLKRAQERQSRANAAVAVSAAAGRDCSASGVSAASAGEVIADSVVDLRLPQGFEGLAWVVRTTPFYSALAALCEVSELEIDTPVLVLPRLLLLLNYEHKYFIPVLAVGTNSNGLKVAFSTLVDPAVLQVDRMLIGPQPRDPAKVIVTHVCKRKSAGRVLDAGWRVRQGIGCGKGYCHAVVDALCRDRERMADILSFASWPEEGEVVFEHDSCCAVAAGVILELVFGRTVDFTSVAALNNCCCESPDLLHKDALTNALRSCRLNYSALDGYEGLAWVARRPVVPLFKQMISSRYEVSELVIGSTKTSPVLVLPRLPLQFEGDRYFIPVIALDPSRLAFFTYVHEECLDVDHRLSGSDREHVGRIRVGHVCNRKEKPATHLPPMLSSDMRCYRTGRLVLDARWRGGQGIGFCKGYCHALVDALCRDRKRMGDILLFASHAEGGDVVCSYAAHRSVAAGEFLRVFFGREVDFTEATHDNCSCGRRAVDYKDELNIALRYLGREAFQCHPNKNSPLLIYIYILHVSAAFGSSPPWRN